MAKSAKSPDREPISVLEGFQEIWNDWIEYKWIQKKQQYKAAKYEEIAFNQLLKYSHNDPEIARQIVDTAIAGIWEGFHPLKNFNNGINKNGGRSQSELWVSFHNERYKTAGSNGAR